MKISIVTKNTSGLVVNRDFVTDVFEKNNRVIAVGVCKNELEAKMFANVLDAAKYGPGIEAFYNECNTPYCWLEYVS
ncbi:MAG: hypothetical protein UX75_C0036G0022 [Candidatus Moranbacteria bacterium GW2011_GWE2_47_10]|nr:MAG: hypothetical protein UX75_C0036G0022 [Candidatus Moranbacteria bacterium GW2011_GWE2_47_10]